MSRINKEFYNKNHKSHIFDFQPTKDVSQNNKRNIQPIKLEIKEENNPYKSNKPLKTFINKEKKEKPDNKEITDSGRVKIIKNQYHYASDIFFTKTMPQKMKQQLKEEAFPKKKEYVSNYDPEKYVKFNNSSFDTKMHELYNEKAEKYIANKERERGKPKKVKISSKGYSEYVEKFNNENYSKFVELNKNHNLNHRETEKKFFNRQNKYKPNTSAFDNYNREFESDIFNIKNHNYKKFMTKNKKKNNLMNRSVDYSRIQMRNPAIKGINKWPADFNWTKNSELIFKTHIKNFERNKSMTAYDRNLMDSVKDIFQGEKGKSRTTRRVRRNRSDFGMSNFKRPLFDKKGFTISRARKLSNNCSVLDDEKKYENNVKDKNIRKKFEANEYLVDKPGNVDLFEFGKLLKSKGIHLIEVDENRNIIENEKKDKSDRVIHFKIRENIYEDKKNRKLKDIEKELKKKNGQLKIKPAPKKKNYRLKSSDFQFRIENSKKKRAEILKS